MSKPRHLRKRPIYGIGINDADYAISTVIDGKRTLCPFYAKWAEMMRRCYSAPHQAANPTYMGCTAVAEWHLFSNFRSWMAAQEWEGKELDKDIITPGNKVYGPDTCLLVDPEINRLLEDCRATRGKYPIGVSFYKRSGKFMSKGRIHNRTAFFGYFDEPSAAFRAYCAEKAKYVRKIAADQADQRVRDALMRRAELIETGEAYAAP